LRDFGGDLPEAKAKALYAVQRPLHKAPLTGSHARGIAVEAKLVPSINGRSDDQPGSRTLWPSEWARNDFTKGHWLSMFRNRFPTGESDVRTSSEALSSLLAAAE
jgi:hypothetical protein